MLDKRGEHGRTERRYQVMLDATLPFRSDKSLIYHPNGFLPLSPLDGGSDAIVLSDKDFGDQLIDSV
jgi:hypothetical protein